MWRGAGRRSRCRRARSPALAAGIWGSKPRGLPLPYRARVTRAPFRIDVDAAVLDDLRQRLLRTRFAEASPGERWQAGTDPAYLRELVGYWANEFDWRARERELNAFTHGLADIEGTPIHYVHMPGVRAPGGQAPTPLVLTHGWPSSFVEMLPLVPLLTDPASHGGDPADSFDLVIPSLPGHLYSGVPDGPLTRPLIADLWVRLMADLGYERFGAHGGDIGADVTNWLAIRHPERIIGIHTIHPKMPTEIDPDRPLTAAEGAYLRLREVEDEEDGGYSAMQGTRPDTLAAALVDSPAGLASWIVDKYRAWGDCGGDVESRFSKDLLLTIITLYWVTGSIGTSFRTYYDYPSNPPRPLITVPTAITLSTEDATYPREMADRSYTDIRRWREASSGGHFMPLEEPQTVAQSLRAFFHDLRQPRSEALVS
jgi:pimeloyl-ACP methyl ester carboxylesterase